MKNDGIASAASAMRYWELRQEVVSNNLANANTDGFKAERVFAQLLKGELPVAQAETDRRTGSYRPTGNPLDLALPGDQFFVVRTPDGERWSRGGTWSIDAEGLLVDADGKPALGEKGPITVTRDQNGRPIDSADLSIDRTGVVSVGGVAIDRLRVEQGAPRGTLQHEEGTHFLPDASRAPVSVEDRDVRQGSLEESNVNTISAMVDMINIQRNFAFAQKVLTTLDGIRATITNEIAKPS